MGEAVCVIGVGNPDRGDDGVGAAVVDAIRDANPSERHLTVSIADPTRLMDTWSGADVVFVVDAVVDGSDPGTIRIIDPTLDPIPADLASISSHGVGVGAAIELARSLGRLPRHLTLVGITAENFDGVGLSEHVRPAVREAAETILEVLQHA